jgi:hypothetical protein
MRWVWAVLVTLGCKTTEPVQDAVKTPPPPPPKAKENAVRLRAPAFDVSACVKPPVLTPVTKETLAAWLDFERPRFEACLMPATARDKADANAQLDVSVSAKETSVKIAAQNVTPLGVSCLEATVKAMNVTNASTVTAQLFVAPPADAPAPNVELLPEANALRAAVTQSCQCFTGLSVNAPPQLVLKMGPETPLDVVTAADPLAEKVERCLEEALAAHPRPTVELTIDLPLLNGDATAQSPDASSELAAHQDALMKRRHSALVGLLEAQRTALLKVIEAVSTSAKRKPTPKLIKERQALCETLIEVEDALPGAVERAKNPALSKVVSLEPSQLCAFARTSDE